MKAIKVRQGETFVVPVTITNAPAISVTFTVWDDGGIIIEQTALVSGGVATIDVGLVTQDVGSYSYGLTIEYADGNVNQIPDASKCSDDCGFPDF